MRKQCFFIIYFNCLIDLVIIKYMEYYMLIITILKIYNYTFSLEFYIGSKERITWQYFINNNIEKRKTTLGTFVIICFHDGV